MNPAVDPNVLADLRDYHLPAPVHWWPPAPGWWIVVALLLSAVGFLVWILIRRHHRRRALRLALAELDYIAQTRPEDFAPRLSRLLRRYALTQFPRPLVAGLTGDAWLKFLDRHAGKPSFSQGTGQLLRDAPYRPAGDLSALDELLPLIRHWILQNAEVSTC